jgi:hypothetical protein
MLNRIIKIRITLWLLLITVIFVLFYLAISPLGKITYSYNFKKDSDFIGRLTPNDRVEKTGNLNMKIIGDPVYFSLRTPRTFDKGRLILKYRTSANLPPVIEAGVLADKNIWRYDLKPVDNQILDKLSLVWDKINEGNIMLLQKEKKFDSLEKFLSDLPVSSEIALYNYDLKQDFVIPEYQAQKSDNILPASLRGSYEIYTYIKEEDLDFDFAILDLNKNKDEDQVSIILYYQGQEIDLWHLDDDGLRDDFGKTRPMRNLKVKESNLPEGVYKIELRANDDIITALKTKQNKIAFQNKIWLYNEGKTNLKLFTDSQSIQVNTINPDSLQTIKAAGQNLKLEETYRQYSIGLLDLEGLAEVNLERDGVIISGNGVFCFEKKQCFNPELKKVDAVLNLGKSGVNYILADYNLPEEKDGWKIASVEFDLKNAYRENQKYGFIISVPGLRSDDKIEDWVEIGGIRVELEGRGLVEKLGELIKR